MNKYYLFLILAVIFLAITLVYNHVTEDERNESFRKRVLEYGVAGDLSDCGFVHSPCPYAVLDKKLDRILELLEKEK